MIRKLERTISRERLTRYLLATKGDLGYALRLYQSNIQVSQTLYGVLHGYEIALRNSMHDQLRDHFGREDWYSSASLNLFQRKKVEEAKSEASLYYKEPAGVPVGKIVAGLNLAFWTGLVAAPYEQSLWLPCLRKSFPHKTPNRRQAYFLLRDINRLRNRVAHHERILGSAGRLYAGLDPHRRTELSLDPEAILECVFWICPATSRWIRETTKFDSCLPVLESCRNLRFGSP